MTEPIKDNTDVTPTTESVTPPTTAQKVDNTENMIPQSRLNEVIQQRKDGAQKISDLEAKLAAFETATQTAETERLESQNEFQKLYEAEKTKNEAAATTLAEKEAAILALEVQRTADMRDGKLLGLLGKAYNPDGALTLLKADIADAMATLVTDGTFNQEIAEKLIGEFAGKNGYLFKSGAPGSLSNAGGKTPNPKGKKLEQAMSDYQRRLKG